VGAMLEAVMDPVRAIFSGSCCGSVSVIGPKRDAEIIAATFWQNNRRVGSW
jgi:hypothetical protein